MICPHCKQEVPEQTFCIRCGAKLEGEQGGGSFPPPIPPTPIQPPPPIGGDTLPPPAPGEIPNYLVWSILATIFCCWPLGIPAIIFSAQVNTKVGEGDVAGAWEASKKAKMWTIITAVVGIVVGIIGGVLGFISGMQGASYGTGW